MPKTVAVMDGLDEVADALKAHGIRVVDVADTGAAISAIVYSARVQPEGRAGDSSLRADAGGGVDDLVLMLNADDLSIEEIVARVKSVW